MQVELTLRLDGLARVPDAVRMAERLGFDGVVSTETAHDAFLPLVLAAEHSSSLTLGTAIALAFPRSPAVTAYQAWDLQAYSGGRLLLGLGSQVKGVNERRFSTAWTGPAGPRMREYIQAMRALWQTWQSGAPLDFRGQHYTLTLMSPNNNPGPIPCNPPQVAVSAVGPVMCRVAGEVCDGVRLHRFSTPRYLRETAVPAIAAGLRRAGRSRAGFEIGSGVFTVTGATTAELDREREAARRQIAFYASTRAYRPVFEPYGWGEIADRLRELSLKNDWAAMSALLPDAIVDEVAIVAPREELGARIVERFGGVLDRINLTFDPRTEDDQRWLARLVEDLHRATAPVGA